MPWRNACGAFNKIREACRSGKGSSGMTWWLVSRTAWCSPWMAIPCSCIRSVTPAADPANASVPSPAYSLPRFCIHDGHVVVRADIAVVLDTWVFWKYCVPACGRQAEQPRMQALATSAHRGIQRLIGSGTVAVERDGETVDDEARHGVINMGNHHPHP